jgi:uncharacterized membrane protein YgaE (UPF0421/DUF939 family)
MNVFKKIWMWVKEFWFFFVGIIIFIVGLLFIPPEPPEEIKDLKKKKKDLEKKEQKLKKEYKQLKKEGKKIEEEKPFDNPDDAVKYLNSRKRK